MKIVLIGGSGHMGTALRRYLAQQAEIVVVSRTHGDVLWDGKTQGDWVQAMECADAVINLAGKSVNCRYTPENLAEMTQSRTHTAELVGIAIANMQRPPSLWLQASTATIYSHRFDAPNDEETGILSGSETNVPVSWKSSVGIAKAWEAAFNSVNTPATRKVAMRSAFFMAPDKGGPFDHLARAAKSGFGGTVGSGKQYISWIHEEDFARAVLFVMEHPEISGPVNFSSPSPLVNAEFNAELRRAIGIRVGIPLPEGLLGLALKIKKSEPELLLKSRRVVPKRLLDAGFEFKYETWAKASSELAKRWKAAYTGLS